MSVPDHLLELEGDPFCYVCGMCHPEDCEECGELHCVATCPEVEREMAEANHVNR